MNTKSQILLTPIYDERKLSRIASLEQVAIEAAILGDEATVNITGHMLAEALCDIPRNFRPCPAISWFQGRPLGIGDHNQFILLALPDLSAEKDVRLEHSTYDTDWKLPGGALQWDGMYSGWIAVCAEWE